MRKSSIYSYYAFGFNYCVIKEDGLLGSERNEAVKDIVDFLKKLHELELSVTYRVATGLFNIAKDLKNSDEAVVSKATSDKILSELQKIDPALDAELQLREAYVLTDKRYSIDKLVNYPEKLLASEVYNSLKNNAKKDFSMACTLIALNQPTGAAFHLMRTLEEQVKLLYCSYKKTKRLKILMWGPMVSQLRSKRNPKPSEKLLSHLDSMRIHFRNPTQHPDAFYNIDESEDLLNQTISAINMIFSELPK
ncbi:hypothetical protein [Microbulbifer sp. TRSA007]|uniref:hypothetical protein n=1 Tax=Microbulbifer sp. TRSA007 TaxID=3243384 RepID=UPI004039600C